MPTATIGHNTGDTFTGVEDTMLKENAATTNYQNDGLLECGNFGGGDLQTTLLRFTGLSNITPTVTVNTATLRLYLDTAVGTAVINIYRELRAWVLAQATWNIFATSNNWGTAGSRNSSTDYDGATLIETATVTSANDGTYIEFTSSALNTLVQNWINGVTTNNGIVLIPTPSVNTSGIFVSTQGTDGTRPQLVVDYTAGGGGGGEGSIAWYRA